MHLDIGLHVFEAHPLFLYFLEKRLAILTSPFFHLLLNSFSVTSFRTFLRTPYLLLIDGRYHSARKKLKWASVPHSKSKANYKRW